MSRWRQYRWDLVILAGFLVLPLLLYSDVTVGRRSMLPVDNLFQWAPWSSYADQFDTSPPHNALISDLIIENYAWKRFLRQSLAAGEIPLWNPYLFAGAPFLATGQHGAYYPFSILFLLLPLPLAYGWYTLSQIWLAGVMTFVLARVLGWRRPAAAMAGLVFQGCGFMVVSAAVFPMIIGAAVWLPLLLACIEMVLRHTLTGPGSGRTMPWVVLGAVALGSQVLAGHIEITYYSLLVIALYAGWRFVARQQGQGAEAWRPARVARPAGWLLAMVGAGLMLGAIQLVPFYEVGTTNFRQGANSLAEIRGWAFPPRRLITLALPDFFGNPSHHDYRDIWTGATVPLRQNYHGQLNPHGPNTSNWGIKNYVEGGIYLGIMPLVLALLGVGGTLFARLSPGRQTGRPAPGQAGHEAAAGLLTRLLSPTGFFLSLSLASLAFIFGTPLYAVLYYGLPFVNQLHSPFRWVFPFSVATAMLAGYGVEVVETARREKEERGLRTDFNFPSLVSLLATLTLLAGALLLLGLLAGRRFYAGLAPAVERLFLGLALAADAFPSAAAFFSYQWRNALILALALGGAGLALALFRRRYWIGVALLVVLADLAVIGHGFNASVDPALLRFEPELVTWLQSQTGPWRVTSFAPKTAQPLHANTPWLFDIEDIRGYDSIIHRQYVRYMEAIEPQGQLLFNRVQPLVNWESINSPLVDLLGVRFIVTEETLTLPKLREVWSGDGLRVYENLAVMPRAYTLPTRATLVADDVLAAMRAYDPRRYVMLERSEAGPDRMALAPADAVAGAAAAATIRDYRPVEVTVAATVAEPAWLVLNDSYFPGWRAFRRPAGGAETAEVELPVVRVNGNFRGVQLPPGAWQVRFRYSPVTFILGGLTSVMGLVVLTFGLVVWLWRRYYDPATEQSEIRRVAKNSLAPMALNLFNRGIDFAFAMFYLRLLGPADAGAYATAIVIAGMYEILANFGLNTYLIREVSRDRTQASRYLVNTTVLRLGIGLIASLPIFVYLGGRGLSANPVGPDILAAILLLMVGMVFSGMGQGLTGLFYAHEVAERPAAVATVTTILKVGFGVIVLLAGWGFVGLAAVSILVNLVTLLLLGALAMRQFRLRGPWRLEPALQRSMVVSSYPLMLNHLLAVIFFQVDVPMIEQINGEEVAGWYSSAYKWVNAFNVIPAFFTFALFPMITRQFQTARPEAERTFRLSIKLLSLVSLPLAAATTILGPLLIGVLGGEAYLPHGAIALQIVIWSIPFGWLNSVTNYVLIALGQERIMTRAFIAGVLFNIVTNWLFLARFSYLAAAVTTILSELLLLAIFNYYLRQKKVFVGWWSLLYRLGALALVTTGIMVLAAQWHWALGLALGLPLYVAGLWRWQVVGADERRILQALLPAPLAARLKLTPASS